MDAPPGKAPVVAPAVRDVPAVVPALGEHVHRILIHGRVKEPLVLAKVSGLWHETGRPVGRGLVGHEAL